MKQNQWALKKSEERNESEIKLEGDERRDDFTVDTASVCRWLFGVTVEEC